METEWADEKTTRSVCVYVISNNVQLIHYIILQKQTDRRPRTEETSRTYRMPRNAGWLQNWFLSFLGNDTVVEVRICETKHKSKGDLPRKGGARCVELFRARSEP